MGCEEQADDAGPEAVYDVSNTWSAMSLGGHLGSVPGPSVSLLTGRRILGRSQGRLYLLQTLNSNLQTAAGIQSDHKVYGETWLSVVE